MRPYPKGRLLAVIVFAVSLLTIVALALVRYQALTRLADEQRRLARSFQLQKEIEDIIAVFRGVEFYERTYLLTGSEAALRSFETALTTLKPEIADVGPLLTGDPVRLNKLAEVEDRLWRRVRMLEAEVADGSMDSVRLSTVVRDADIVEPLERLIDEEAAVVASHTDTAYEGVAHGFIDVFLMTAIALVAVVAVVIGLVADLRRRQRTEVELRLARDQADTANRAKSLFIANVSHEIRTPMTAIAGFSELLLDGEIRDDERRRFADAVQRNCVLLTQIIDDILDTARADSGKLRLDLAPCNLADIVDDVVLTLGRQAAVRGTALVVAPGPDLPERIVTDAARLRQILLNIVGNAVKFTAAGRVELAIKADAEGQIAFTVTDDGPGIAPEHQGALFKPFGQADASTRRVHGGTGLGLALARQLATALGGDVVLERSSPGSGSAFRITVASQPPAAPTAI